MAEFTIFTDGASRGNPGLSSTGFVIKTNGETIYTGGSFLGVATNNIAEYTAIIEALQKAQELSKDVGETNINFRLDSKLAVEQLSGRYKIKHPNLKILSSKVKILESLFLKVTYTHVPREQNQEADAQANLVLDK